MVDATELFQALEQRSKFQVVEQSLSANKLRVIGRIPMDALNQCMQNWLIIARNLLLAQEAGAAWNIDISKQYFLKGSEGSKKIVYGHRLIIQAENVVQYFPEIINVISGSKPSATVEMNAFPLPGVTSERNVGRNGKGANVTGGR